MSADRFWMTVLYAAMMFMLLTYLMLALALVAGVVLGWWS